MSYLASISWTDPVAVDTPVSHTLEDLCVQSQSCVWRRNIHNVVFSGYINPLQSGKRGWDGMGRDEDGDGDGGDEDGGGVGDGDVDRRDEMGWDEMG